MHFKLQFSEEAKQKIIELEQDGSNKGLLKQLRKVLGFMETNLKHPSLHTHKFSDIVSSLGDVFESYAQNNTPGHIEFSGCIGQVEGNSTSWI